MSLGYESGLGAWNISVFIIMQIKLNNHQLGLPRAPEGLAVGGVIAPLKGARVGPGAVVGETGIPSLAGTGIAGGTTGKLS